MNPYNLQTKVLDNLAAPRDNNSVRLIESLAVWTSIVHVYTFGDLSQERDKLIAISGVAREFGPLMQCRYLAGLWVADLVRELCWSGSEKSTRSRNYRAPSWSWASTNGVVWCFVDADPSFDGFHPLAEILESHIDLVNSDKMGQVNGGFIRVQGQLIELSLQDMDYEHSENKKVFVYDQRTAIILTQDSHADKLGNLLYCLPIGLSVGKSEMKFFSLALQPTGKKGEYKRVGHLSRQPQPNEALNSWFIRGTPRLPPEWLGSDPLLSLIGRIGPRNNEPPAFTRHVFDPTELTIV